MHFLKTTDAQSVLGKVGAGVSFATSMLVAESLLRLVFLILSICLAWVTYKHIQEKRAFLRKQQKEPED